MSTPEFEASVETLAAVFRAIANHPLPGQGTSAAGFYKGFDDWARHLLTGAPPPGLAPTADAPPQRQWVPAQAFFRERRQAEQNGVQRRERELNGLAQDLLGALRDASVAYGEAAGAVEAGLQRVQTLLAGDSVEQLRAEFATMAGQMRATLNTQRATLTQQLTELRQRAQEAEQAREEFESQARELGTSLADIRQALEDARRQMQLDPLTQLYNRGAFDAALRRYIDLSFAGGQTLVLLMLDLDHFKSINDRCGHQAGDGVLTAFANLLSRSFLRLDDFVARYGGEEFAVLVFVEGPAEVQRLVDSLFERVRALRLPALGPDTMLTCSVGYAILAQGDDDASVVARADAALYKAKHNGRDRLEGPD
ncbi:MAG: diguanylate cyclase [Immundisolibacter sp.]|uniref:GGDEF domain-containing protein n=1 Tax=Immundisolibacter sp. TaxID=1934948 RepID=UPI003EE2FB72